ncbi:unnamed protein product [Prunus brigantina]
MEIKLIYFLVFNRVPRLLISPGSSSPYQHSVSRAFSFKSTEDPFRIFDLQDFFYSTKPLV